MVHWRHPQTTMHVFKILVIIHGVQAAAFNGLQVIIHGLQAITHGFQAIMHALQTIIRGLQSITDDLQALTVTHNAKADSERLHLDSLSFAKASHSLPVAA